MPAIDLISGEIRNTTQQLSHQESLFLELDFFIRICEGLKEYFRCKNKHYFQLIKLTTKKENTMLDNNLLRYVICDIILTEEYSLEGLACYTHTSEDVICDIAMGRNTEPSLPLSRKIINLHRTVRPEIYKEIIKKITPHYFAAE